MCTQANADAIEEILKDFVEDGKCFTAFDVTQEGLHRGTTTERHSHLKSAVHGAYDWIQDEGYTRELIQTCTGNTWLYYPEDADIRVIADEIKRIQGASKVNADAQNASDDEEDEDDDVLPSPNTSPQAASPSKPDPSKASQPTAVIMVGGGQNGSDKVRRMVAAVGSDQTKQYDFQVIDDDSPLAGLKPGPLPEICGAAGVGKSAYPGSANPAGETKEVTDKEGRLNIGKKELEACQAFPGHPIKIVKTAGAMDIIPVRSSNNDDDDSEAAYIVNTDGRIRIGQHVLKKVFSDADAERGAFRITSYPTKIVVSPIRS